MTQDFVLYMKPSCPFCRKVLRYMEREHISLPMKDISAEPAAREELVAIGGKGQVPCLVIKGKPLYESDDIIAYLSDRHNS